MAKQEFSVLKLADSIRTEADAYRFLEELRWPDGKPEACPLCGAVGKFYFLAPKDGSTGRKTRTGANTQRRVWKCATCRKQFSVLTNTVFHGTKVLIRKWVLVMFDLCASKNSISAWEVSRRYEVTNETAWHMLHRLREAMKMEPVAGLLGGAAQVDEAWIGGNPKNRHRNDPREPVRKSSTTDKQPVVALVHYETRAVHAVAVPEVTGDSLLPAITEVMDAKRTHLHTDSAKSYRAIAPQFAAHESVNHEAGEYARGDVSTNLCKGLFSHLKRSIDGTHHAVST